MKANINTTPLKLVKKIPKSFNLTDGYHKLSDAMHYEDGWRDVVIPAITEYQSLTDLYFDDVNDVVTYYIYDFTQEEKDKKDRDKEDNEDVNENQIEKFDSDIFIEKYKKRLRRQGKGNGLNKNQSKTIRKDCKDVFLYLMFGWWDLAKDEINSIPDYSNKKLNDELTWLKNEVNSYIEQK